MKFYEEIYTKFDESSGGIHLCGGGGYEPEQESLFRECSVLFRQR